MIDGTRVKAPIGVAILGSTGSIGKTALRVLERQTDRFVPIALTANSNRALLAEQATRWNPTFVGLVSDDAACLVEAATRKDVQIVLNAVVGAAGMPATLAALRAGKRVALANKETLVMAGHLVTELARTHGGVLVPVDSEHSAILQCPLAASRMRFGDWCSRPPADRFGRGQPNASRRPRLATRSNIPPGRWAARSRSTAPPSRTKPSR